ncbi:GntR family transcriptional regulator [Rhodobacterales bacterium LSUCC0246]|nr:GntR family transcriptional regulator [Rhodobacterales bacterium LSUCC0374]
MWRCTQYDDFEDLEQRASRGEQGLAEDVFRHLRLRILNGEFVAGDKLRELTISKELGVSRATVREATRRLSGYGLLEMDPQRGVFLRTLSLREVEDLYELRENLCGLIGRRFVERATAADRAHIATLHEMIAPVKPNSYRANDYIKALAFSEAVVRATGNNKLFDLYHASWQQFRLFKIHLVRSIQKGFEVQAYNRQLFFASVEVRQSLMDGVKSMDAARITDAMASATSASRDGAHDLHARCQEAAKTNWRQTLEHRA